MRAAGVAGGLHPQLAGRVGAEKVAGHPPRVDHLARLHAHALVVERRRALAARDERVFHHVDVPGKHRLAQRVDQERGLAVERATAERLRQAAQQAGGQGRLEQHRALPRADLAAVQAAQRALGGVAAHGLGRRQVLGPALGAVPVVALHLAALARQLGDGRHRQAVARAGIAAAKAVRVGAEEMALLRRHARAFAVADALVHREGGALAGQRHLGRLLAGDGPGVEQVQVALLIHRGHVGLVGQAGHRILGGEAGDVVGRLHRALDRGGREVRGAGVAAPLADVDRHAQRLVAVALHRLQLALAHAHAQARALRGLGAGIAGAQLFGVRQRGIH